MGIAEGVGEGGEDDIVVIVNCLRSFRSDLSNNALAPLVLFSFPKCAKLPLRPHTDLQAHTRDGKGCFLVQQAVRLRTAMVSVIVGETVEGEGR